MLPRRWMEAYINFLLKFRWAILIVLTAATLFLGFNVTKMEVQPNFFDFYPPGHEYIQLYQKYRRMFGTANILSVIIEVKEGVEILDDDRERRRIATAARDRILTHHSWSASMRRLDEIVSALNLVQR